MAAFSTNSYRFLIGGLLFLGFFFFRVEGIQAQTPPDTEVFLADIRLTETTFELLQLKNVSENEGYDSQPSFSPDGQSLLFASNRGGETDVVMMSVWSLNKLWLTHTPNRSEYSPQMRPGHQQFSFITLSPDGVQDFRLIEVIGVDSTRNEQIIESEKIIGYYTWLNESDYLCFVLPNANTPTTLQWHKGFDPETELPKTHATLSPTPGRSFHPHPDGRRFSYIDKSDATWNIVLWNPETEESSVYAPTLKGAEDMAWLPTGQAIMASGSEVYVWNQAQWQLLMDLSSAGIQNITRLAVNKDGEKLALVGELSARDANN